MVLNDIYTTEEEKFMYLKGLLRLSKIDGIISDEEVEFLHNAAVGMQLNTENIERLQNAATMDMQSDEAKQFFKLSFANKKQGLFFLKEAIQLCHVDKKYDADEQQEVSLIAKELGISSENLSIIEEWVKEGFEWLSRGEKLINLEA